MLIAPESIDDNSLEHVFGNPKNEHFVYTDGRTQRVFDPLLIRGLSTGRHALVLNVPTYFLRGIILMQ